MPRIAQGTAVCQLGLAKAGRRAGRSGQIGHLPAVAGSERAATARKSMRAVVGVAGALPEVPATGVPAEAWLLDVREDAEWAAGHAPNARHIPLGQLGAHTADIPQDQQIYVICRSGVRSASAAQALNGAGWQAVNVAGGMQDWAAGGRPMVSDSGAAPFVA